MSLSIVRSVRVARMALLLVLSLLLSACELPWSSTAEAGKAPQVPAPLIRVPAARMLIALARSLARTSLPRGSVPRWRRSAFSST